MVDTAKNRPYSSILNLCMFAMFEVDHFRMSSTLDQIEQGFNDFTLLSSKQEDMKLLLRSYKVIFGKIFFQKLVNLQKRSYHCKKYRNFT